MARHDVPTNIKYILDHTGKEQLSYMGWSQGTTQMFVAMQDEKTKDYIAKTVNLFAAIAPVATMHHQKSKLFTVLVDTHMDQIAYDTIFQWGFMNADSMPAFLDEFCKLSKGLICDFVVDIIAG